MAVVQGTPAARCHRRARARRLSRCGWALA